MTDYQNSKIYKITSAIRPDLIYIGSTTLKYLSSRMSKHRYDHKTTSNEIILLGDAKIKLIHKFPCNTFEELRQEEQRVMDTFPSIVNRFPAYRDEEFKLNKHAEESKLYRERHPERVEKLKNKLSIKYTCDCGKTIQKAEKSRHERSAFHLANI